MCARGVGRLLCRSLRTETARPRAGIWQGQPSLGKSRRRASPPVQIDGDLIQPIRTNVPAEAGLDFQKRGWPPRLAIPRSDRRWRNRSFACRSDERICPKAPPSSNPEARKPATPEGVKEPLCPPARPGHPFHPKAKTVGLAGRPEARKINLRLPNRRLPLARKVPVLAGNEPGERTLKQASLPAMASSRQSRIRSTEASRNELTRQRHYAIAYSNSVVK